MMAPDDPRHGSENAYSNLDCRCDSCREAHRLHARKSPSHRAGRLVYQAAAEYLQANYPEAWDQLLTEAYERIGAERQPVGRPKKATP